MPTTAANPPSRLNRGVLTVIGLVLVIVGVLVLLFGLGLLAPLTTTALPGLDPSGTLLPAGLALPVWATYLAIVVAVVVGLLCLRWLLAQTRRRPRTSTWSLAPSSAHGTTTLPADSAAAAVAAEIEGYAGVRRATATLAGARTAPELQLEVDTERGASLAALRDRITGHALPRLRHALDLETLPTQLLLRIDAADSTTPRAR